MTTEQINLTGQGTSDEFSISQLINAPKEKVWKAWTEKDALEKWWGPKGLTLRVASLDLRPGGVFHYCMRTPDGRDMWGKFVYREVTSPERLVFVASFTDEQANPIRHPFSATWPLEVLSTVHFEGQGAQTNLKMTGIPMNATEVERKTFAGAHHGMRQGWTGTLDQLAAYLSS